MWLEEIKFTITAETNGSLEIEVNPETDEIGIITGGSASYFKKDEFKEMLKAVIERLG